MPPCLCCLKLLVSTVMYHFTLEDAPDLLQHDSTPGLAKNGKHLAEEMVGIGTQKNPQVHNPDA